MSDPLPRALRRTSINTYDVLLDGEVVGHIDFDGGYYMPFRRQPAGRRVAITGQFLWPRDAAVAVAEATMQDNPTRRTV